jgi:Asp-tRNA(Asn)/Glu-tRNA(Gln) amidotransferase A subunit family amidase
MKALGESVLSETARARLARGLKMSPADYRRALSRRDEIRARVAAVSAGVDCFVTLASSGPAPIFDDSGAGTAGSHLKTGSRAFLSPWSMIGGPSMSLPLLSVDGMPLGIQIMGAPGKDRSLVAIAAWIDASFWPQG